jgi:hypothetical protein
LAQQVQSAADGGKHNDTGSIKTGIINIFPRKCLQDLGGTTPEDYLTDIQAPDLNKSWRGFGSTLTAIFLCPVDHVETMKANPAKSVIVHISESLADRVEILGLLSY